MYFLYLVFFTISVKLCECSYWQPIPIDYVGSVNKTLVNEMDFCEKNICIADASRMGLWMNHTQNRCDDFYEFVCGSFLYHKALNERYVLQGLQRILYDNVQEQRRKALAAKVNANDSRAGVIAKNLFQKCVDSRYILKKGKLEVLKFLDGFGGFPMLNDTEWNSEKFDKAKIFESIPYAMKEYFHLGFELAGNVSGSYIEIQQTFTPTNPERKPLIMMELFRQVAEDIGMKKSVANAKDFEDIAEALKNFSAISTDYLAYPETYTTTSKELNDYLNHKLCGDSVLQLNWTSIFEAEIPVQGSVGDDFEISIRFPHLICDTLHFMTALDNRTFSNYFALMLLAKFREHISVYFHTKNDGRFYGTSKAPQRFEQCSKIVRTHLPVAFTSLLIERFANPTLIASAKEVANRTVNLFIQLLKDKKKYVKQPLHKLETLKLIIGYPEEILDRTNVERHHETLNLTGGENFFELRSISDEFNKRLRFRRLTVASQSGLLKDAREYDWTQYTTEDENIEAEYDYASNIIYFPTLWLQEPYFHPDRPRYAQDATFGVFLGKTLFKRIGPFLRRRTHILKFDFVGEFFKNYKKFDESTEVKDQPLPGFLLTNQQMFWMTLVHKNCVKFRPDFTSFTNGHRNADAYFKVSKDFQRAFGCDLPNLNEDEIRGLKSLYDDFY